MANVTVNGMKFHYWQVGDGEDMVLIHGLSGNLALWHFTVVPKLRGDYRLLTYDLRGHGRSDMPPTGYTTRDMAEDLRGLLDSLGIEKAHLVGHSLGADVALHFSLLYPERVNRIVAIEAGIAALVHLRKRKEWAGWAYWAKMLKKYGEIDVPEDKWDDIDYMLRESLKIPIVFGPARGLPRRGDHVIKLLDRTTLVKDYENCAGMTLEEMSRIDLPVLLVYGSESQYLGTYETLRDVLPRCTPLLLDGAEHFGPMEKPDELIEHIRAFIDEDRSPTAAKRPAEPAV